MNGWGYGLYDIETDTWLELTESWCWSQTPYCVLSKFFDSDRDIRRNVFNTLLLDCMALNMIREIDLVDGRYLLVCIEDNEADFIWPIQLNGLLTEEDY